MGYYIEYDGEIRISPPLTWKDIQAGPDLKDLAYLRETETVQTEEGTLTKITAHGVKVDREGPTKAFPEQELHQLAEAFPDRTFTGFIEGRGEDFEGHFRLLIHQGEVAHIKPVITWPQP